METYILLCLDGHHWIARKWYADLQVTQQTERAQITNIAGAFRARGCGKYWVDFSELLAPSKKVPEFLWLNMPDSAAREIAKGLGMDKAAVKAIICK